MYSRTNSVLILCFVSFILFETVLTFKSEVKSPRSLRNQFNSTFSRNAGHSVPRKFSERRLWDVSNPHTKSFIETILNAAAVFGLGTLWIKEVNNAIGSPVLSPILLPFMMIFAGAMLFVPQLRLMAEKSLRDNQDDDDGGYHRWFNNN